MATVERLDTAAIARVLTLEKPKRGPPERLIPPEPFLGPKSPQKIAVLAARQRGTLLPDGKTRLRYQLWHPDDFDGRLSQETEGDGNQIGCRSLTPEGNDGRRRNGREPTGDLQLAVETAMHLADDELDDSNPADLLRGVDLPHLGNPELPACKRCGWRPRIEREACWWCGVAAKTKESDELPD
jgi:hypothetical protein